MTFNGKKMRQLALPNTVAGSAIVGLGSISFCFGPLGSLLQWACPACLILQNEACFLWYSKKKKYLLLCQIDDSPAHFSATESRIISAAALVAFEGRHRVEAWLEYQKGSNNGERAWNLCFVQNRTEKGDLEKLLSHANVGNVKESECRSLSS